jgi:integrase
VIEGKAVFHTKRILDKASQNPNRKLENKSSPLAQPPKQLSCPQCSSQRLYKDGLRYLADGATVQRWLCRECYYRFSEKKPLQENLRWQINTSSTLLSKRQVCELLARASKNLTTEVTRQETAQREGTQQSKVSVEAEVLRYLVWLKNQAYSQHTIRSRADLLKGLIKKNADLNDPESVKAAIANADNWSETTKLLATTAYDSLLKWQGKAWIPPRYRQTQKIPFIPTEEELDALIAVCRKKIATMLQILKETGARLGEAFKLEWTDVDFTHNTLRINHPEKGSNPRILPISNRLNGMINTLPKKSPGIFGGSLKTFETSLWNQRKKAAFKLQNPRLLQITFHTFRHWKATIEYHKTHDIFHVQRLLGHKNIQNTAIYINLENSLFKTKEDDFHVAVAKTLGEACKLLEVGFEYVCDMDDAKIFRKRK